MYIYHFWASSCLCVDFIFPRIIFLLPNGLPLTFLVVWICGWWILSTFIWLEKSLFCFPFKRNVHRVWKSRLIFFFSLSLLYRWCVTVFWLVLGELCCHFFLCSLCMYCVFLWLLLRFSLYHWFWTISWWSTLSCFRSLLLSLGALLSMWDLSSWAWNWTHTPCSRNTRVLTTGLPGSP